ncbi:uncharacterized protein involved in exopolysaccharide biosynthesis [Pseudochelatococcus lubricantis]|uniref:Uncharacterized protein involved in exopolysaccharide biosynthesis n=1 Tax=Pseudochelatococcus lubricantis TaxID=1538102 RepID=A0ABX0V3N7_9HYPH|nr:lipopolysaccharide biosynthesis protein [Pseudochelatococcus lubricantis]NIJ59837.1 uncharacterized protein involved in exopolysaccharide biosynthesis [Pseudochelatococcus lubricantis]
MTHEHTNVHRGSSEPAPQSRAVAGKQSSYPDRGPRSAIYRITLRDIFVTIAYYRRIAILAALIPILIGISAAIETHTVYTAEGLLMVLVTREQVGSENLTETVPTLLSIEGLKAVESEVSIIGSSDVIRATIDEIGAETLFPGATGRWRAVLSLLRPPYTEDQLIQRFRDQLDVRAQSGSNIIQVHFSHTDRALAARVTDTLIGKYLDHRRALFESPRSGLLAEQVRLLAAQLEAKEAEIHQLKATANIIDISQDRVLAANQVDSVLQRTRQIRERREAVIGQLARAQEQLTGLDNKVFDSRQVSNSAPNDDPNLLTRLLAERQQLLGKYAASHPAVQAIDRQIAAVRDSVRQSERQPIWTNSEVRNPAIAFVGNMIITLKIESDALDRQLTELASQHAAAEKRVSELLDADRQLTRQTREQEILNTTYRDYVQRAEAAKINEETVAQRRSNVRLVQSPQDAVTSRNMALPFLIAGLFGGVLFGAAAVGCATVLRSTFISPGEAERETLLPALAVFPDGALSPGAAEREVTVSALVARLFGAPVDDRSLAVLMVTDVDAADDKRHLIEAMACELCVKQQRKVLLVETTAANSVLTGETRSLAVAPALAELGVPVSQGPVAGLHIARMTGASLLDNPHSLAGSPQQLFDTLRSQYDAVLLSMAASDNVPLTQYLASAVDASLLVVRAERSRGPVVLWLRDLILDAGGGIVGFVFTGRKFYLPERLYKWS